MTELFLLGALVGFAITAPPGPVGGLCIERTMRGGLAAGFSTALGALVADAFYGALAAFGLTQVATPSGWLLRVISAVVAAALLWLGVRYLRRAWHWQVVPEAGHPKKEGPGLASLTLGTCLLTLGTPLTLPAFAAMYTSVGLPERVAAQRGGALVVVAGVVCGAAVWWTMLCAVVHRFRTHAMGWLRGMEFAVGFLLLGGAVAAIWKGFVA